MKERKTKLMLKMRQNIMSRQQNVKWFQYKDYCKTTSSEDGTSLEHKRQIEN